MSSECSGTRVIGGGGLVRSVEMIRSWGERSSGFWGKRWKSQVEWKERVDRFGDRGVKGKEVGVCCKGSWRRQW